MNKLLLLCNNKAGKATIKKYIPDIINYYNACGYEVTVYISQYKGHIVDIIMSIGENFQQIVCCGGDGTLNETVSAVTELTSKPVIGYIPCGSTNDFAQTIGLPSDIERAYKTAIRGSEKVIDIGDINGRYFSYVCAFGIFTNVSYETPQNMKNMLGHLAYVLEGMKQLSNVPFYKMSIEYDGGTIEDEFVLGFVANSKKVGGFTIYGDDIDLDDGLFEVLLVRKINTLNDVKDFMSGFLSAKFDNNNLFYCFKTSYIRFESGENINWTVDGEYCGTYKTANITNHNKVITIKA